MDVLNRDIMIEKIIRAIRAYLAILNMNPDAARLIKRRFLYRKHEHEDSHGHRRIWINILLFVITFITTTFAGVQSGVTIEAIILSGLPFSITIMAILLSHEMGHYLAARHFGVKATLPYFIPFPSIIGTMGAVIKIKSPIRDKRALLYIGIMGPLAGFILSLIASVTGISLSEIKRAIKFTFFFTISIVSSVEPPSTTIYSMLSKD